MRLRRCVSLKKKSTRITLGNMNNLIVSIGAGATQLPFIKILKEKGYLVAAFGKGRNHLNAIELCDYFREIDTSNSEEAINWLKELNVRIAGAGSFAGGHAINTLHEITRAFKLPTSIPRNLSIRMDKFEQQKFYEKYGLASIKTFLLDDIKNNPNIVRGISKFIIKPSIGRGSAGVYRVNLSELYNMIENNKLLRTDVIQELQEGEEYRMLIIIQNSEIRLLAPVKRESFHKTFFLGRLSYNSKDINQIRDYVNKMIKTLKLKDIIIKADIIVNKENVNMIEMDIGVGGGIYYKSYISKLFDYDINSAYVNLITGNKVPKFKNKGNKIVMDYVYNFSGKSITYDNYVCKEALKNLLQSENIALIPNLLHPETKGKFESNADFIFCIIHNSNKFNNLELNDFVNAKLFSKVRG